MQIKNQIMGKRNVRQGMATEEIACMWLRRYGFLCIEPIETPWRIIRHGGRVVGATPEKKVSGDFTAIEPSTGRHVHVEVKSRDRDTLRFSDIEAHQRQAMDEKVAAKALCLVLWVKSPAEVACYKWPIQGFGPGKSLKWGG